MSALRDRTAPTRVCTRHWFGFALLGLTVLVHIRMVQHVYDYRKAKGGFAVITVSAAMNPQLGEPRALQDTVSIPVEAS